MQKVARNKAWAFIYDRRDFDAGNLSAAMEYNTWSRFGEEVACLYQVKSYAKVIAEWTPEAGWEFTQDGLTQISNQHLALVKRSAS